MVVEVKNTPSKKILSFHTIVNIYEIIWDAERKFQSKVVLFPTIYIAAVGIFQLDSWSFSVTSSEIENGSSYFSTFSILKRCTRNSINFQARSSRQLFYSLSFQHIFISRRIISFLLSFRFLSFSRRIIPFSLVLSRDAPQPCGNLSSFSLPPPRTSIISNKSVWSVSTYVFSTTPTPAQTASRTLHTCAVSIRKTRARLPSHCCLSLGFSATYVYFIQELRSTNARDVGSSSPLHLSFPFFLWKFERSPCVITIHRLAYFAKLVRIKFFLEAESSTCV